MVFNFTTVCHHLPVVCYATLALFCVVRLAGAIREKHRAETRAAAVEALVHALLAMAHLVQ